MVRSEHGMATAPLPSRLWYLLAFIITAGLGYVLYGDPARPTDAFTHLQQLGTGLIFAAWAIGLVAWGAVLARLFRVHRDSPAVVTALGAVWAAFTACVLGLCGIVGPDHALVWKGLLALGVVLCAATGRPAMTRDARPDHPPLPARESQTSFMLTLAGWSLWSAVLLVYILVCANASRLNFFQDPLWYNLVAPRFWYEHGRILFDPTNIAHYHGGFWDVILLWGHELLAGSDGRGMIAVHFFGQWTHAILGFGGSALAIYSVARLLGAGHAWALLAVLGGLTPNQLLFTASMAKNDWGSVLWVLSGLLVVMSPEHGTARRFACAGLLLGAAFSSKFTTGFILLPLVIATAWTCRRHNMARHCGVMLVAAALGAAPIVLRNWLHTGNPFFPALNTVFNSPFLGPTWQAALGHEFEGWRPDGSWLLLLVRRVVDYLLSGPTVWLLLVFPIVWRRRLLSAPLRMASIILFAGFLLFCLGAGPGLENRLFGSGLVLGSIVGAALTHRLLDAHRQLNRFQAAALFLLAAGILVVAEIPWNALSAVAASEAPSRQLETLPGWQSIAWVRHHLTKDQAIVFTREARTYYLTDWGATRISDHASLDRAIADAPDLTAAVDTLLRFKYTHMLIVMSAVADPSYINQSLCSGMFRVAVMHRNQVICHEGYRNGQWESMVVDLAKLRSALESGSSRHAGPNVPIPSRSLQDIQELNPEGNPMH